MKCLSIICSLLLWTACILLMPPPGRAAIISGTVTEFGTGDPIGNINVGFTRTEVLTGLPPDSTVPVETQARTNPDGTYSIDLDPDIPGVDQMLVFTESTQHFNRLYNGVETSGFLPSVSDVSLPGVVTIDLTEQDYAQVGAWTADPETYRLTDFNMLWIDFAKTVNPKEDDYCQYGGRLEGPVTDMDLHLCVVPRSASSHSPGRPRERR